MGSGRHRRRRRPNPLRKARANPSSGVAIGDRPGYTPPHRRPTIRCCSTKESCPDACQPLLGLDVRPSLVASAGTMPLHSS